MTILSHHGKNEAKVVQVVSWSKWPSLVRDSSIDSELCHQTENSLDLGWTAGATSKVSVLLRPQRLHCGQAATALPTWLHWSTRGHQKVWESPLPWSRFKTRSLSFTLCGGRTMVGKADFFPDARGLPILLHYNFRHKILGTWD